MEAPLYVTMFGEPKGNKRNSRTCLKSGEIDKTPGEREKVDKSGSLVVKPGELADLHH